MPIHIYDAQKTDSGADSIELNQIPQHDPDDQYRHPEVSVGPDGEIVQFDDQCRITWSKSRRVGTILLLVALCAVIFLLVGLLAESGCSECKTCKLPKGLKGCTVKCPEHYDGKEGLKSKVTATGITRHLKQLFSIAQASDGHRSVGSIGYNRSIAYVREKITTDTNFHVTEEFFVHRKRVQLQSPLLTFQIGTSQPVSLSTPSDFLTMSGSASGTLTASVAHAANRGCDTTDFNGNQFSGRIAIVRRGSCYFSDKVANAVANGAIAVVIYNSGDDANHMGMVHGTVGSGVTVPVFAVSYITGLMLGNSNPIVTLGAYESPIQTFYTSNLCAESLYSLHGGDERNTVVVGAHLDSVPAGPGINDNGSGSMAILEIALQLADVLKKNRHGGLANRVRFCWWGAEEVGLKGSHHYVTNLNRTNPTELKNIAMALNFDMVGSPNFIRGIYNGTMGYAYGDVNPTYVGHASTRITELFMGYFKAKNLSFDLTEFNGRSDYGPFLDYGIPAGGLDTGADGIKTEAERHDYGGMVGIQHDPCYHQKCDTVENVSPEVLGDMGGAAAYAIERLLAARHLRAWLNGDHDTLGAGNHHSGPGPGTGGSS